VEGLGPRNGGTVFTLTVTAGVVSAAVTWGVHAESLLRANAPDHVVTEPRMLADLASFQARPTLE
jgi:hypothetical protein